MKVHGIAVRDKKTKELIHFVKCSEGSSALRVLSGVRRQMDSKRYYATEEYIPEREIKK